MDSANQTCISMHFKIDDMCDKCKYFDGKLKGLYGRKPGKNVISKCEKPWDICITSTTESRLIHKKQTAVNTLKKYGYTNLDNTIAETNIRKRYHCLVTTPNPDKPSKKTQMKSSEKKTPSTQISPRPIIPSPRRTPRPIMMSPPRPRPVMTSPRPQSDLTSPLQPPMRLDFTSPLQPPMRLDFTSPLKSRSPLDFLADAAIAASESSHPQPLQESAQPQPLQPKQSPLSSYLEHQFPRKSKTREWHNCEKI